MLARIVYKRSIASYFRRIVKHFHACADGYNYLHISFLINSAKLDMLAMESFVHLILTKMVSQIPNYSAKEKNAER